MGTPRHRAQLADMPEGADNPLNAAVTARDRSACDAARLAIRHRQCLLAYQPVVQARPGGTTAFYEGLIRVLDETGRVIPAGDFMPVLENTETGREIDCVALEMGLRTLARNPALRLSLNMSARSIGYRRWRRVLDRFLKGEPGLGERLILEISEASVMTVPELVGDFMRGLHRHGISFALDDFGSGACAPRFFRDLLFDMVKIDGAYVRGIHRHPQNQMLVRALIAVAREFGMATIAESVESEPDSRVMTSFGIDCLQGYLTGAPSVRPPWKPAKPRRDPA